MIQCHRRRTQDQSTTITFRFSDETGSDDAIRTRAVFDNNRATGLFSKIGNHHTSQRICGSARSEGNNNYQIFIVSGCGLRIRSKRQ